MWVAKIKISSKGTLIGSKTKEFGVDIAGYPVSFHKEKNWFVVFMVGTIFGEEINKKKFVSSMKKSERVTHIEIKKDFLSALIKEPLILKDFYNPNIIYTKPVFISKEGYEIYNMAAWDKSKLIKFISLVKKMREGKLLSIKQEELGTVSLVGLYPKLTAKQKKAIDLAIKNGYYSYPRKIELEKLAKLMGCSYSTYQAHLRKAELKIIPFTYERV